MKPSISPEAIAKLAEEVLRRNGVTFPPVDVDEIAGAEGLTFSYVPLEQTSAVYFRDGEGRGHAPISSFHHPTRQRFSKGHELGHHLMDEPRETWHPTTPVAYRGRDRHWAQDFFAANLLMPRAWIANFYRTRGVGLTPEELVSVIARRFDVSRAAAGIRLRELGYIQGRTFGVR